MDFQDLIEKIENYQGSSKSAYIEHFNSKRILSILEEVDEIQNIEKKFVEFEKREVNIFDFVRIFLNIIHHEEDETLYLSIALIDLFKNICDTYNLDTFVKTKDILNYIIESFLNRTIKPHIVPKRKLPGQRKFDVGAHKVREIDLEAPIVYGETRESFQRLTKTKMTSDSTDHKNNVIKKACFASEIKRMFTLDSLADNICIYNLNCVLERRLLPERAKQKKDIIILDFFWSKSQQRIGATLKDLALTFWEADDNYQFEKTFSIVDHTSEHQLRIWYIDFLNYWLTTDKTCELHIWDIEKENMLFSLSSSAIRSSIIDVVPLDILKLVAVCSLDRIVTFWNFNDKNLIMKLDLTMGGIHSIVWSNSYRVLVTAGYENALKVWEIDSISRDVSKIGKLIGHLSMVCAVEFIESTPMIVSADDSGHIKVWDIRNLNCVQTLQLDAKITISKLIDVFEYGKMAFIGTRLNFIGFEKINMISKVNDKEAIWPIKVEYNVAENKLIVCTRKDIRFVDIETGKISKIYAGLLENEDDISVFQLIHHGQQFVLGDDRGHLKIFNTSTGEFVKSLGSHTNEITVLKVDFMNKHFITSSFDSKIQIQKESKGSYEVERVLKNLHFKKEVTLMEVSVYHSIILSANSNNSIYIWDYEFIKLLGQIRIHKEAEPTCIHIINRLAIIVIAESLGKIHFLHFKRRESFDISFQKIGEICLSDALQDNVQTKNSNEYPSKILANFQYDENYQVVCCELYVSTNQGIVIIYDILEIIKNLKPVPHANTKSNYNCHRIIEEDFLKVINYKTQIFNLQSEDLQTNFMQKIGSEDKIQPLKTFKAHNDNLTTLSLAHFSEKRIITASLDSYLKIWTLNGDLLGSWNINHPLPILWDSQMRGTVKYNQKILYALKILDGILQKNKAGMFLNEQKKISINNFLEKLSKSSSKTSPNQIFLTQTQDLSEDVQNTEKNKSEKKIILMKDEYSPRDIQFQKVKNMYQQELRGHSLKQMEVIRRLAKAQKEMNSLHRKEQLKSLQEEEKKHEKIAEEERAKLEFLNFLLESKDNSSFQKKENPLAKKLDLALNDTRYKKDSCPESPRSPTSVQKSSGRKLNNSSVFNFQRSGSNAKISKKDNFYLPLKSFPKHLESNETSPRSPKFPKLPILKASNSSNSLTSGSPKHTDFYLYVQKKKMNFIKEEDSSNECKTNDNSVSKTFERNIKKKNFSKIISKLNEDRKKAQHSNSYSLNPIDINSPSNIYQLSKPKDNGITTARLKIENQFSPTINSSRSFSEDKFKAKKFKSFAEELKELKEQMLELGNQSPIQKIVKRPLLKLDLEKVQTGEDLKFTLSHSSRKCQNDYPMPKNDVSVRGVDDFDMRKLIPRQKQLNLKNK